MPRTVLLICLLVAAVPTVQAQCVSSFLNPISGLNWRCAFPMNLGGLIAFGQEADNPDAYTKVGFPICTCLRQGGSTLIGVNVAFWEPARLIETVKDPYCFPSLGVGLPNPKPGSLGGEANERRTNNFVQAHYYVFPVWAMLKMFVDVPCLAGNKVDGSGQDLDLAMITEVLPTWNNDLMAFLINPEALLFANPASVLSCMADAAAATKGMPLNELFWCMGGWPTVYPVAGSVPSTTQLVGNTTAAGRLLYQAGRAGLLLDHGIDSCGAIRTLIWRKRNYRFHFAQPVKGGQCLSFGTPPALWEHFKNKPVDGDNFSFVLFRRVQCCVGW